MSISALNGKRTRRPLKTALVYLGAAAFCFLVAQVYGLYGHGVTSPAMTWMFLYPLLGGTLAFLLLRLIKPAAADTPQYPVAYNLYNSGIATLTVGSLLKGIFDIAGTSSPYTILFSVVGGLLAAAGAAGFLVGAGRMRRARP